MVLVISILGTVDSDVSGPALVKYNLLKHSTYIHTIAVTHSYDWIPAVTTHQRSSSDLLVMADTEGKDNTDMAHSEQFIFSGI